MFLPCWRLPVLSSACLPCGFTTWTRVRRLRAPWTNTGDCGAVNHSRFAVFPPMSFDEASAASGGVKSGKVHIPVAIIGIAGYGLLLLLSLAGAVRMGAGVGSGWLYVRRDAHVYRGVSAREMVYLLCVVAGYCHGIAAGGVRGGVARWS